MGSLSRFVSAMVIASVIAAGPGAARLEARGRNGTGTGHEAICSYLQSIIEYPNVNQYILTCVLWLCNDVYRCGG
jgi:hypothetical protein